MHQIDLSIVTVNWNTRDLVIDCVKSLDETVKKYKFEYILVDNGSEDGSIEAFKKELPHIKIIETGYNAGSTRANNIGMKAAKGRYIMMLNSDTVCTAGAIDRLVDYLEENLKIGAVCGQLLNEDGSNQHMVSPGVGAHTCSYFSKNNDRIIFASTFGVVDSCPPRPKPQGNKYIWPLFPYDIYSAKPDGSDLIRIRKNDGYDAEPTVSFFTGRVILPFSIK